MLTTQEEMVHHYGPRVHILSHPLMNGLLAQLCSPNTQQPQVNRLVETLYTFFLSFVIPREFKSEAFEEKTRMTESHPEALLKSHRIAADQKAVVVNLARAGTFPSHLCYSFLHCCLHPTNIRQDHIFASRVSNKNSVVSGTEFHGMKIGGGVGDSLVIIPDPMGATGNTMSHTIDYYKNNVPGSALKYIALNLIITPEYLQKVLPSHPDLIVYALRLDRGLSPQAVLDAVPGKFWDQERGLNDHQYIVPGGGGFGEIMNNSFV